MAAMELAISVAQSVVILFGLGAVGFAVVARKTVPEQTFATLVPFALDIALPSLVLVEIAEKLDPQANPNWHLFPFWMVGFYGVSFAFAWLTSHWAKPENRRDFIGSLLYHNAIFFPLVIIKGSYGHASNLVPLLFLLTMVSPPLVFSTYPLIWGKRGQPIAWSKIINPVLIAAGIGLALKLSGAVPHVPAPVKSIMVMLAGLAIPLLMLIMGGNVYVDFRKKLGFAYGELGKYLLLKLLVFPMVVLGLLLLLRPDSDLAFLLFLQSAVPALSAVPIFAERCGGNRHLCNQLLVGGFIASVVTLPIMLRVFDSVY